MSIELETRPLAPRIADLLAGLRTRIRGYVWADGLAALVTALGVAFWATLAFDWAFEPPWQFRALVLVAVAVSLAYLAYRLILRRAFRPLDDTNLALVLERRFSKYRDSLLTTVEMGRHPDHAASFNQQMLRRTWRQADDLSQGIHLGDVFRLQPLVRSLGIAAALALSVLLFAVVAQEAFATWVHRVVLLDPTLLWPRANHVRVADFPADRIIRVAKGTDFEVIAVADLTGRFRLPDSVQVRYSTGEGTRGRDNMTSVGVAGPRDHEQKYSYIFKGIMSPIEFDIFGGDDRDRDYRIDVVDNPTISRMLLDCKYPEYTGRPANTVPASGLVQLPQGTEVTIHCEANKDLVEVPVTLVQQDKPTPLDEIKLPTDGDRRHFSLTLPVLMADTTVLFDLHDADGIRTRDPVRLALAARADEAPLISLRLRGISTAVTPQARLPIVGDVRDDYGLARLWFEFQLEKPTNRSGNSRAAPAEAAAEPQSSPGALAFHTSAKGADGRPRNQLTIEKEADESLDLKRLAAQGDLLRRQGVKTIDDLSRITSADERSLVEGITTQAEVDQALAFVPQQGGRLLVSVKAADNCALPAGENVAQGERYQLDIVSAEQLLSILEGRELMLRRQFEIIYQEMVDTRDALARLDFAPQDSKPAVDDETTREPGDKNAKPRSEKAADDSENKEADENQSPEQKAKKLIELRNLRVNRAMDNGDRSAHETLTVADSFDDLREEMVNNRIDTPDLQIRLKDQIADPLRRISTQMFPQWRGSVGRAPPCARRPDDRSGKTQNGPPPGRRHHRRNETGLGQNA